MHKVKLYYLKGKLHLVGITLDDISHLTADVRYYGSDLFFVLSNSTCNSKILNEADCKTLVEDGYYILVEKEIEVDIQKDIYTYCYIDEKFYLVDNK